MNLFDDAVESVIRRGFHDAEPHDNLKDVSMMRQLARLGEEYGELCRAMRGKGDIIEEAIDVMVVCTQVLYLQGLDGAGIDHAMRQKMSRDESRGYLHGERH